MANERERLEYLRGEIRAERISYGEIAELQGLVEFIDPGDVELLEWAGVPERSRQATQDAGQATAAAWEAARARFFVEQAKFLMACRAEVQRVVRNHLPAAESVCLHGEYNEDGLIRLALTCISHDPIDPSDDLADILSDDLDEVLMYLAENSGEDYLGDNVIEFDDGQEA